MIALPNFKDVIARFELQPHPEGGWYRETYRAPAASGERASSTAIYYLLEAGAFSHWHRIDATEVWHFYAGAPLVLSISSNGHDVVTHRLGPNISPSERPQVVVEPFQWQAAESLGAWTLVGCTVVPGFQFEGFELAPPDWRPTPRTE
ncbi:MAG: cupin domain-containing protein [Parvularculaceae bacterium]|nr:MAG: cupin domain-containing protein [Parvularculaceae bacterium]